MAWSHVQDAPGSSNLSTGNAVTSLNINFGSASTLNNFIVVCVAVSSNQAFTVSDNGATPNSYTKIGSVSNGTASSAYIYVAKITSLPSSGNLTVTLTVTSGSFVAAACASELSGGSTTTDGSAVTATGSSNSTWAGGPISTTTANDLLISAAAEIFGGFTLSSLTQPSGYTVIGKSGSNGNEKGGGAYKILSGTVSSQDASWTPAGGLSETYATVVVALQPASGPTTWSVTVTEHVGLVDNFILGVTTWHRLFAEAAGLLDSFTRHADAFRIYTEAVGVAETPNFFTQYYRILSQGLGVADRTNTVQAQLIIAAEALGVAEKITTGYAFDITVTEAIGVASAPLAPTSNYHRPLTDAIGIADSEARIANGLRLVTDPVGLAEIFTRAVPVYHRVQTEPVGVADIEKQIARTRRLVVDPPGLAEMPTPAPASTVVSSRVLPQATINSCTVTGCSLCTELPNTVLAFLTGNGPTCSCFGQNLEVVLVKTANLCQVNDGLAAAGWVGMASIPGSCANTDTEIQVSLCCFFLGQTAYAWQVQLLSLPGGQCSILGITSPGNSCVPFMESHIFQPVTGLNCCSPHSTNQDQIQVVVQPQGALPTPGCEPLGVVDNLTVKLVGNTRSRNQPEAVGVVDRIQIGNAQPRPNTCTVGISEVIKIGRGRAIAEPVGIGELIQILKSQLFRQLSDPIGISDTNLKIQVQGDRKQADSVAVLDTLIVHLMHSGTGPTDAVGIADTTTLTIATKRKIADTVAVMDIFSRANQNSPGLSCIVGVADTVSRSVVYSRALIDQMGADVVGVADYPLTQPAHTKGVQITCVVGIGEKPTPGGITHSTKPMCVVGVADSVTGVRVIHLLKITCVVGIGDYPYGQSGILPDHPIPIILAKWALPIPVDGQTLYLVRGRDQVILFVPPYSPFDISSWSLIRWELRYPDGTMIASITKDTKPGDGLYVNDAHEGLIEVDLARIDTYDLPVQAAPWYWELRRYDFGESSVLARGTFILDQDIAD